MSRFALIIESSNVVGYTDLPGARADADSWVSFLKSTLGGSWSDTEMKVLHKPLSQEVNHYLDLHKDKYCFVAFSGHGCHSEKTNTTYAVLNEYFTKYPIDRLKPRGAKGTLIVDACRWTEWEKQAVFEQKATGSVIAVANSASEIRLESGSVNFSATVPRNEAYKWLTNLHSSVGGIVTMYSCAIGEDADEFEVTEPKQGGHYTTSLMGAARVWSTRFTAVKVYTTKNAHDDTAAYMDEAHPQQHPTYEPSYLAFPFAVKS